MVEPAGPHDIRHSVRVPTEDYVFPEPWRDLRGRDVEDASKRSKLEAELLREVADEHALARVKPTAVARCVHCDDALFALGDGRFAAVHLSYPKEAPDRPPWPRTKLFDTWAGLATYAEEHAAWA